MSRSLALAAIAMVAAGCTLIAGLDTDFDAAAVVDDAASPDVGIGVAPPEAAPPDAPAQDVAAYRCIGGGMSNDPKNCGRLWHDCLGGSCNACACQAYTVADDPAPTAGITFASAPGAVYWANEAADAGGRGSIWAFSPGDGGTSNVAASAGPREIVADPTYLYWADPNDGLLRSLFDGGSKSVVANLYNAYHLGLDPKTELMGVAFLNGTLYACTAPYCNDTVQVLYQGAATVAGVAIAGDTVVWTDTMHNTVDACRGLTCQNGDYPYPIIQTVDVPSGVAAHGSSVYFVAEGTLVSSGKLYGSDVATPKAVEMTTRLARPKNVAADDSGVYFTTYDDGLVRRCPTALAACTPEVIAKGPPHARYIALDSSRVYWTVEDGKVLAVAKP
jgi:hypothetical protein